MQLTNLNLFKIPFNITFRSTPKSLSHLDFSDENFAGIYTSPVPTKYSSQFVIIDLIALIFGLEHQL